MKGLQLKQNDNPVSLSLSVCQNLMFDEPIYAAVLASTGCLRKHSYNNQLDDDEDFLLTLSSISFTCAYYNIPVIDVKNRDSVFF